MSVINQDYMNLQKAILAKQAGWKKDIIDTISYADKVIKDKNIPLIEQVDLDVSLVKYKEWIVELIELLTQCQPAVQGDLNNIKEQLNEKTLKRWVKEAITVNGFYFTQFAEENRSSTWIPQFLAEHAIRPYLRALSEIYALELADSQPVGTCPCCGEPVRLARLEGKVGKKVMYCPRCYASWQEKRTKCSHCGKEHDDKMTYLQLEEDPSLQLYICNDCNGYVKVIDSKEKFKKEEPALLDLNTIHLDILAQEKGFGAEIKKDNIN